MQRNPGQASIAPIVLMLASSAALSQTPTGESVEKCATIEDDARRLACYDTAFGRQARDPKLAGTEDAERKEQAAGNVEAVAPSRGEPARPVGNDLFAQGAAPAGDADAGERSLLDSRWELTENPNRDTFDLLAYKPVYLLPLFWSSNQNETPHSPNPDNTVATAQNLDSVETKYQLSFKTMALENLFDNNGDVWMGYTQSSRWQVYNGEDSRPFRETNYEPEMLLVFRSNVFGNNGSLLGWKGRMAAIGVNHQSNGRADPLSRSWNRVMFNVGLDRDQWALMLRPWIRISDGRDDDNPDIEDYVGRGDMTLVHSNGKHQFSLMARHSLRGGDRSHGALQFDWGYKIHNQLRWHLQVFDGYGESLIDYNHRATYVGFGISLLEWY